MGEQVEAVCCAGCQAAAAAIYAAGLADYYRFRSTPAPRASTATLSTERFSAYSVPAVAARWVTTTADGSAAVHLLLEGVSCAACTWLVEKRLQQLSGVRTVSANPATARVVIHFDPAHLDLGTLLQAIAAVGFTPHVLGAVDTRDLARRERASLLRRLAVAGFGMMQVMMFALALYAGAFDGMDAVTRRLFQLFSLLVTVPVAFYAGSPFLRGAVRSLRAGEIGMDVTVSLAILIAFFGSAWQALTGAAVVWFDSVVMFVFLLLLARLAEMGVRHAAGSTTEALLRLLPAAARRRTTSGIEQVPCDLLQLGDLILVPGGEAFPTDAMIIGADTTADESLVTGESAAVPKPYGATVLAGSLNAGQATECRVTAMGEATTLARLVRLIDQAQSGRPALARRADRLASRFLAALLLLAMMVGALWAWLDPTRLVPTVIAVLVVACPCALSLAVPTVLTAALRQLAQHGVLVVHAEALERLAGITDVVFDKTGTLTRGQPSVTTVHAFSTRLPPALLQLAAALEAGAAHPLARAFPTDAGTPAAQQLLQFPGDGLEGVVNGERLRIGRAAFVSQLAGPLPNAPANPLAGPLPAAALQANVFLGSERGWLGAFTLEDALRPGVTELLQQLRQAGLQPHLLSGDRVTSVAAVAARLGFTQWRAEVRPADKVAYVQALQAAGARVAMVGDGLNDAPVLAVADVSLALQEGTALARAQADLILAGAGPQGLWLALTTARRGLTLMQQNLRWSAAYNLLAVPAAAAGLVPPWLAAIGMSASSLGVVLNAIRLTQGKLTPHEQPAVDRSAQPRPGWRGPVGVLLGGRGTPVR